MSYVVIKKKNGVHTIEAVKLNLKRSEAVAKHPHDKYATYLICQVVDVIKPNVEDNDTKTEEMDR